MSKSKSKRTQSEPTPVGAIKSALWGMGTSVAAAIILMVVFSGIALLFADPGAVAGILGYVCLYLSAASGGFVAFKRCRGFAVLCGFYTGLGLTALTLILSLLIRVDGEGMNAGLSFLLRIPTIAAAIGGAMLATYRPQKRHRRHRR